MGVFNSALSSSWSIARAITSLNKFADWMLLRLPKTIFSSLKVGDFCNSLCEVSKTFNYETLVNIIEISMEKSLRSLMIISSALSITRSMSPSMIAIFSKIDLRVFIGSCLIYSYSRAIPNRVGFSLMRTWLKFRIKSSHIEILRALK